MPEGLLREIHTDTEFDLGDLKIRPFSISHDAYEPSGYRIACGQRSVAVATDLGVYDDYTVENLKGLDAVLLEANHDIHMLEVGPYPYPLKRRVMGGEGASLQRVLRKASVRHSPRRAQACDPGAPEQGEQLRRAGLRDGEA